MGSRSVESAGLNKKAYTNDFLPNLCSVDALLGLLIIGQLVAIVLVIASDGISHFNWLNFGLTTFLMQWIVLCSIACICPLKEWFRRSSPVVAVAACYVIVLTLTFVFSITGRFIIHGDPWKHFSVTVGHLCIAIILLGIFLRYFYMRQRLNTEEQSALEARLQALQSRIRPHFLFNSMNSIASLISMDSQKAEQMVVDLAELFRASLKGPTLALLTTELELCKRFIAIECIRLGDRLRVGWEIHNIDEHALIPSLMLQPLLENAIYHGVQPLEQGGEVRITVEMLASETLVKISNPRLPGEETSQNIRHRKDSFQTSMLEGNGIAMDNIRYRLKALFGTKASLRLVKGDTDFTVILRYPTVKKHREGI